MMGDAMGKETGASLRTDIGMKGRSLLTLDDLSNREMTDLLALARALKQRKRDGVRGNLLQRRNIAMIFEKMSTRTRCAASVAAADEGARAEYLAAHDIHLGQKESPKDTARVLGRMYDGILFRGYRQQTVEMLARYSGIPVWNGLTDTSHPTQTLADLMSVEEVFGRLAGLHVVYVGDGRNNVANSLMIGCAKAGMRFTNCTPPELAPLPERVRKAEDEAARTGGEVRVVSDPRQAVAGANVIYTDVWVSMGEEAKQEERLALLRPYQVDLDLMRATGNLENGQAIFLHCLPAFHDADTALTRECGALEVTDEVFEAPCSRVFDVAENRMHTIKAIFVATL
jgi:ornithine carbamoyltransferase